MRKKAAGILFFVCVWAGAQTRAFAVPELSEGSVAAVRNTADEKLEEISQRLERLEENQQKILKALEVLSEEHQQLRYWIHKR